MLVCLMENISNSNLIVPIRINQSIIVNQNIKTMIKTKTTISDCYAQAREALAQGNLDKARDMADYGIVKTAEAQETFACLVPYRMHLGMVEVCFRRIQHITDSQQRGFDPTDLLFACVDGCLCLLLIE